MKNKLLLFCILTVLLFTIISCKYRGDVPSDVDYVLRYAGGNRPELEKVLVHYRNDSLKYQAACFLIGNMLGHFFNQGEAMEYCKHRLAVLPRGLRADSMDNIWKQAAAIYTDGAFEKIPDYTVIKSSYLIENIDKAFCAWKNAPWHKEIGFEIFCQYILPYRISDEQLADDIHWRDSLAQRYAGYIEGVTDVKQAFVLLSKVFDDVRKRPLSKCPYMLDAMTMEEAGFSLCEHRCVVRGNVMRALGLPVVCDNVNGWANYSRLGHSWISLVGNDEEPYTLYEGDSVARADNPIDASYFKPLFLPDASYSYFTDSLKRAAKVYRQAFNKVDDKGGVIADVSEKYGLTDSVVLQVNGPEKWAYLCTYKTGDDWKVAIKSEVSNGSSVFRNLGASIVYLPAKVKEGGLVALDAPFILNRGGWIRKIIPTGRMQRVRLNRKYILMANWTNRWYEMLGCCFEASNDPDFHHSETLWHIQEMPVYRNEVKVRTPKPYRYIRYVSPGVSKSALAELALFSGEKELQGEAIGEGLSRASSKRVFDNNLMTIGDPKTEDYWVGLDLGKQLRVDKIVYYPRNDDNFITPGDLYELFHYFEGTWHSLKSKVAENEELIYEQVPEGALFLLKNRTKGSEERIFTYENGRQIWW